MRIPIWIKAILTLSLVLTETSSKVALPQSQSDHLVASNTSPRSLVHAFPENQAQDRITNIDFSKYDSLLAPKVKIKVEPDNFSYITSADGTLELIRDFKSLSLFIDSGDTVYDLLSEYCANFNSTYEFVVQRRIENRSIKIRPLDGSAEVKVNRIRKPVPVSGFVEVPFCIQRVSRIEVPIAVLNSAAPIEDLYSGRVDGRIIRFEYLEWSEFTKLVQASTEPENSRPNETAATRVNRLLNEALDITGGFRRDIVPANKEIAILPPFFENAVVSVEGDKLFKARLSSDSFVRPEVLVNPDGLIQQVDPDKIQKHCGVTNTALFSVFNEQRVRSVLNDNARYRTGALGSAEILIADTGLLSPRDHVYRSRIPSFAVGSVKARAQARALNYSHGSQVLALAAGDLLSDDFRKTHLSEIKLIPYNVFPVIGEQTVFSESEISKAVRFAASPSVVNLSLKYSNSGDAEFTSEFQNSLFVVAAGNDSVVVSDNTMPAHLGHEKNVIAVGALAINGHEIAGFSNSGQRVASISGGTFDLPWSKNKFHNLAHKLSMTSAVTLAAPGCLIPTRSQEISKDENEINFMSVESTGTSFAAPQVSLVASMMFREGINYPALVKDRLLSSADYLAPLEGIRWGRRLNAEKALIVDFDQLTLLDGTIHRGSIRFYDTNFVTDDAVDTLNLCGDLLAPSSDSSKHQRAVELNRVQRVTREFFGADGDLEIFDGYIVNAIGANKALDSPYVCPKEYDGIFVEILDASGARVELDSPDGKKFRVGMKSIRDISLGLSRTLEWYSD